MDRGAFEELGAHADAARAFEDRHAELGRPLLAVGWQIGEVAHADEFQPVVIDAEHLVAREIDRAHVVFDHVVGGGLTETQETIVRVEREKVREQRIEIGRRQFAHENGTAMSRLRTAVVLLDRRDGASSGVRIHHGFSYSSCVPVLQRNANSTRDAST